MAHDEPPTGEEGRPRLEGPAGLSAWVLCAEFVQQIVADAQEAAARDHPDLGPAKVDWGRIWLAGDGALSDEAAIGRIVRAASTTATKIASGAGAAPVPSAPVQPGSVAQQDLGGGSPVLPTPLTLVRPPPEATEDADEDADPTHPTTQTPATPLADEPTGPSPVPVVGLTANRLDPAAVRQEARHHPEFVEMAGTVAAVGLVDGGAQGGPAGEPDGAVPSPSVVPPIGAQAEEGASDATPEPAVGARSHAGWATFFTWVRNVGAIMLLFVAWQLWGTSISQHQAQDQLRSEFDAAVKAHPPPKATGAGPALIPAATRVPSPPVGQVVAELRIPKIGVDQFVVEGTDATELSKGPGHYVGTAAPGQAGNVAIAGHRTTNGAPFNRLGELTKGDRVVLTTTSGERLTYVVSGTPQAVSPSDVAVLNYFGDNRITLTTCTPEFSAAQRLIAVAMLQQSVGTPKVPASSLTYHVQNSATASWNWSSLPAVAFVLALLVLLGIAYKRFDGWFGKHGKWFILVPVWAAGLYLLFTSLVTFLPDTF